MAIKYTFAFKFWFVLSLVFLLLDQALLCSQILPSFDFKLQFQQPCSLFYQSKIAFLLFNFFAQHNLLFGILDILCSFALMAKVFTKLEKKYSTLYMIFDVLIRNIFMLIVTYLVFVFFQMFEGMFQVYFFDYPFGWHSLMIYYYWKNAQQNPQSQSSCCSIRRKYTKWILMIITVTLTFNILSIIAASYMPLIQRTGFSQEDCEWYERLITKMQKRFCSCLTQREDFILLQKNDVEKKQEEKDGEKVDSEIVFENVMNRSELAERNENMDAN